MKRKRADAARICKRSGDRDLNTKHAAEQFKISHRLVQQLVKEYRGTDAIPELETSGGTLYADCPDG